MKNGRDLMLLFNQDLKILLEFLQKVMVIIVGGHTGQMPEPEI